MKLNCNKKNQKTILITGAAKRIGASLAEKFADLNWNVLIHYNNSEVAANELCKKINSNSNFYGTVKTFKADLKNENEIIGLFNFARNEFPQIDVLVNNAGIFPPEKSVNEIDSIFWDEVFSANLRSQFLTSREFSKIISDNNKKIGYRHSTLDAESLDTVRTVGTSLVDAQNTGQAQGIASTKENFKIINFSSLGGLKIWNKKTPYNVSKTAVIQLTKALARELAPQISVNCICPGIVKIDENEKFAIPETKIPMQKYATVEDIFELVYFFATATNYITGQIVSVDGGLEFV